MQARILGLIGKRLLARRVELGAPLATVARERRESDPPSPDWAESFGIATVWRLHLGTFADRGAEG